MAVLAHSSSTLLSKEFRHHLPTRLLHFPTKPAHQFIVKSQSSSSTKPPKPTSNQPIDGASSATDPPTKKPTSTPPGRGSSSSSTSTAIWEPRRFGKKKKQKGGSDRASIIRRTPVEKPGFVSPKEGVQAEEPSMGENAFVLAWLGLGSLILIEGIALAASGFLPEEWDKFLVKYLYPVFTPTVFLFIAGTVTYGVIKYLQNEELKKQQ